MQETQNYKLKKIDKSTDKVLDSVEYLNENFDTLDTQLFNKIDKEEGKGLSTNDYSNEDKDKLDKLPANPLIGETDPTVPSWAKQAVKPSYTFSEIQNKPDTYTPSTHTHNDSYYTKTEIDTMVGNVETILTNLTTGSGV